MQVETIHSIQLKLYDKHHLSLKNYSSKLINPLAKISLIAIKDRKNLELWFESEFEKQFIKSYPILAASGNLGPKLKEGDKQVPEGIYSISYLNPNSLFHLSMKLNYPNELDLYYAQINGRTDIGSDIFIHGKSESVGCIAIGDEAIEEIFYFVSVIGYEKTKVIMMPTDFRKQIPNLDNNSTYENAIYEAVLKEIKNYIN